MSTRDGSRQFRALMARLKPVAEQGFGETYADVARALDIRPRKPTHRPSQSAHWMDAHIGRIRWPVSIAAMFDETPTVLVFCSQVIGTEHAKAVFHDLFGNCDVHHSPSGKGWWMTYMPPGKSARQLIATFDLQKKQEAGTALFSCAILTAPLSRRKG